MASTVKEKVKVSELSKFGFKVGSEYLNYSKKFPEDDKVRVVPGAEFEAELYVADSGKRYLNKILSSVGASVSAPKAQPASADTERAKVFTPKFQKKAEEPSDKMSKSEWQAKDRSQLIGGLSHDAAAVAVAVLNLDGSNEPGTESALRVYKTLLEGMLKIRDEIK